MPFLQKCRDQQGIGNHQKVERHPYADDNRQGGRHKIGEERPESTTPNWNTEDQWEVALVPTCQLAPLLLLSLPGLEKEKVAERK